MPIDGMYKEEKNWPDSFIPLILTGPATSQGGEKHLTTSSGLPIQLPFSCVCFRRGQMGCNPLIRSIVAVRLVCFSDSDPLQYPSWIRFRPLYASFNVQATRFILFLAFAVVLCACERAGSARQRQRRRNRRVHRSGRGQFLQMGPSLCASIQTRTNPRPPPLLRLWSMLRLHRLPLGPGTIKFCGAPSSCWSFWAMLAWHSP